MADRYVRVGGGNWNAAGTWESSPGGGETVAVPTAADQVYLVAGSGQLTINAAAACRAFDATGYANTITHNGFTLTIGDSTAPASGIALVLAGTYNVSGATAAITFTSSGAGTHTIDYGGKTIGNQIYNNTASYQLLNGFTATTAATGFTITNGTVDFNGVTATLGYLSTTGTNARTITFGAANLTITQTGATCFSYAGSNLTITANTAIVDFTGASPTLAGNSADWNGMTIRIKGAAGTFTISGANTFKDIIVNPTAAKTVVFPASVTTTLTGKIYSYRNNVAFITNQSSAAGTTATISIPSSTVNLFSCSLKDITFSGGVTVNAPINALVSNVSGVNYTLNNNLTFYIDITNGDDTTTDTAMGFYRVAYTNSSGTAPIAGETMTGSTSGKTAVTTTFVDEYEWNSLRAGYLYSWLPSGTFVAETLTGGTGSGTCDIGGDFSRCSWKTTATGASAARLEVGSIIRYAKSPDPTSLGQTGVWGRLAQDKNGIIPAAIAITSSTNASPIVITKAAHGLVNGDIVRIWGHTTNTNANGTWRVANKTDNTFELEGSTGTGGGNGGATGSIVYLTHRSIVLTTAVTKTIEECESNWTAGTNVTSANAFTTAFRNGAASLRIITAAGHAGAGIIAKFALPAQLDLSGYQQISFHAFTNTGITITAGQLQVKLYSDTNCTNEVESFDVPAIPVAGYWHTYTVNKGSNLSATVNGIAIYATAAFASKTLNFDHFIACKNTTSADSVTLSSLISKESTAQGITETWYAIQAITGNGAVADKVILIDNGSSALDTTFYYQFKGYWGTGGSATVYKREGLTTTLAVAAASQIGVFNQSGNANANVQYQGGYNIATGSQDGETIFNGVNSLGYCLIGTSKSYITVNRISAYRYQYHTVLATAGSHYDFQNILMANCNVQGMSLIMSDSTVGTIGGLCNNYGVTISLTGDNNTFTLVKHHNGNAGGTGVIELIVLQAGSDNNTFTEITNARGNGSYAVYLLTCLNNEFTTITDLSESAYGIQLSTNANNNHFGTITNLSRIYYYAFSFYGSHSNIVDEITTMDYNSKGAGVNYPIYFSSESHNNLIKSIGTIDNSFNTAIKFNAAMGNRINYVGSCDNSVNYALAFETGADQNYIGQITTTGSTVAAIYNYAGQNYVNHASISESTEVTGALNYANGKVFLNGLDGDVNNHWIYTDGGTINSDITNRHTASGIAWKLSPTSVNRNSNYPLTLSIAKVACNANSQVVVKTWVKKSHATDIGAKLVCSGGQIAGVIEDVTATKANDADYEELTLQFTPTEVGVVEIEVWAYWVANAATQAVYVDDMTIAQV